MTGLLGLPLIGSYKWHFHQQQSDIGLIPILTANNKALLLRLD